MNIVVKEQRILLDLLLEEIQTNSKTKIRNLIKYGSVTVDGVLAQRADATVQPGQVVEIKQVKRVSNNGLPFTILYEDEYVLAVEKPAGMLSMSDSEDKSDTFLHVVNEALRSRNHNHSRALLVHRLDRETSGIMVFVFSPEIRNIMQENWQKTEKLYYALVEGHPPKRAGVIQSWLRESSVFKVFSGPEGPDAKHAITHYRQIKWYPHHALLEVRLETGRKNQIRVHLADIGCPVVGDKKYGAKGNTIKRMGLHAFFFSFDHPVTGARIELKTELPKAFDLSKK